MTQQVQQTRRPVRGRDVWPLIHAERAALAEDLAGLDAGRWETESLCAGLSVREVLAHLTAAARLNPVTWFAGVVRCRFDFDRQVAMQLERQLGADAAETLARFRAAVPSRRKPPLPPLALLGETVVHGEDIRRPLGIRRAYPAGTLTAVAGYYAGTDLVVVAKGRIGGLRLVADDGPFTAGPESGKPVTGGTLALVMAMTGRADYCAELRGEGVELLRERAGMR
ncbi:maleylpyruvate isomerase family mycothiol-dependent enzyme [Streptomyces indicus]|uniref:TIGR03083 family protein n=1 Tax=Streptomyces indicus TaxID=417292 RepID=A0A1G9CCC8_9ACTN|nr:maleylpyruvate isomerase family mycothiol-dependent enzyme [Streptomyces indicus]SDK49104.1 TIGR03083 family protein [Streptomyces indicus]